MQIGAGQPAITPELQANSPATQFQNILDAQSAASGGPMNLQFDGTLNNLGEKLLERLETFVSRGQEVSKAANAERPTAGASRDQMEAALQSLEKMFDRSIEVQLVVRGATGMSGAANTLLRGQ